MYTHIYTYACIHKQYMYTIYTCIYNTHTYDTLTHTYKTHITYIHIHIYAYYTLYRFDKQSVMNLDSKLLSILKKDEDPLAVAAGGYTICDI